MTFAAYCRHCRGFKCECEPLVALPHSIEVTDEMVEAALRGWYGRQWPFGSGTTQTLNRENMQSALVAALKVVKP